jgi:hypothetical protein
MKGKTTSSIIMLLLLSVLQFSSCTRATDNSRETPIPSLEEILSEICSRKAYSDSLQARYEVDTLAREIVEAYMVYDSSFSQNMKKYQRNLELRYDPIDWNPIASGIKINLDKDAEEEIACFLGTYYSAPHFLVFDYVDGGYKKILDEYLWLHNEHPKLKVLQLDGQNIIRTGHFYYRGSGHWLYAYQCYAMSEGKMRQVAEFPYRSNLSLSNPIMSRCDLVTDSVDGNQYILNYSYSAQVSNQYMQTELNPAYQQFEIVKDVPILVTYTLNKSTGKFAPNDASLVAQLMNFENDTCAFELIEPYLKAKNQKVYKSFKSVLGEASCSSN